MGISINSCFGGTCSHNLADSLPAARNVSALADSMKASAEFSGCKEPPHHLNTEGRHHARPLFTDSILTAAQSAHKTETNCIAYVDTQWRHQAQPRRDPIRDPHGRQDRLPHATNCERASIDPPDPSTVMGPQYHTQCEPDMAMGTQPLLYTRPARKKTHRPSMDQTGRHVNRRHSRR